MHNSDSMGVLSVETEARNENSQNLLSTLQRSLKSRVLPEKLTFPQLVKIFPGY